jgi:hypothetical protein
MLINANVDKKELQTEKLRRGKMNNKIPKTRRGKSTVNNGKKGRFNKRQKRGGELALIP